MSSNNNLDIFNLQADDIKDISTRQTEVGVFSIPDVKKAKDQLYVATIRFIPNIKRDKTFGELFLTKDVHFVKDLNDRKELQGAYDCQRSVPDEHGQVKTKKHKCQLCSTHFDLKNSNSVMDKENADKIGWRQEFFSYVQVIEDETRPENVGKILVFRYGKKIFEKIEAQKKGLYGKKVNVFSLTHGANFRLVVKLQDDQNNYDESLFLSQESDQTIKLNGKKLPYTEKDGMVSIKDEHKDKIFNYFLERERDLEEFAPAIFDEVTAKNVSSIDDYLRRNTLGRASESVSMAGTPKPTETPVQSSTETPKQQSQASNQVADSQKEEKGTNDPFDDF